MPPLRQLPQPNAPPVDSSQAQTRNVSVLEGRVSAQAGQVGEMANVLTRVQESAAQERGTAEVIDAPHNSVSLLLTPYRNGCGSEFLRVKYAQECVEVRFQNENVTGFFFKPGFLSPTKA